MIIAGGHSDIRSGTKWIGSDGWVWVNRGGFEASNKEWEGVRRLPEAQRKVSLYESRNHWANFIESVKSRKPTIGGIWEVANVPFNSRSKKSNRWRQLWPV